MATGTSTQTLLAVEQAVRGKVWTKGTSAQTLPEFTQAVVATFRPDIRSTLPEPTTAATGHVWTKGTIAATLPEFTQAVAGTHDGPIYTGTAASVLPEFEQFVQSVMVDTSVPPLVTESRISVRRYPRGSGLSGSYENLTTAKAKRFMSEVSTPGSFSVNLALDDPVVSHLVEGDYIQFLIDGTARFTGIYERKKSIILHPQNHVAQTVTLTGASTLGEWKYAVVRSPTPVDSDLYGDVRHFDWSSPELDDSGWDSATVLHRQDEPPSASRAGKPLGFPLPSVNWIWSATHAGDYLYDPGISPFRGTFTLAEDASVALYMAADDGFVARLNGVDLGGNGKVNGWKTAWRADVDLPAGTHVLGVLAENYDREASTNSAGYIAAVYTLDASGRDDVFVAGSSAGTKTMHYPETLPGFTVGHVLRILLEENQAEGALVGWTLDCSDTLDAAGAAWETDQAFTFDVGRNLLSVLEELSATHLDYIIDQSTKTLHVYGFGTANVGASVATLTSHVIELEDDHDGEIINSLLVTYAKGQFTATNAASVAVYGNRWDYLSLGGVENRSQAESLAQAEVDRLAQARSRITAPMDGRRLDTAGENPFDGWTLGNYVTLVNASMAPADYRVLGIAVEENDKATITVTPTLNSRADEASIRLVRAFERMEWGTIRGRSLVASPPRAADSVRVREAQIETIPVSLPGSWADGAYLNKESTPYKPDRAGRFVWAEWAWNDEPTTDVEIGIKFDGTLIQTQVLPAGEDEVNVYPNRAVNREKISVVVLDDDFDASGLTGKFHFVRYV